MELNKTTIQRNWKHLKWSSQHPKPLSLLCLCVCIYAAYVLYGCSWMPKVDTPSPKAGVIGDLDIPEVGLVN